jgi:asparagine synthase (glutamine-hydrolysing)
MCGIAGFIDASGGRGEDDLRRLARGMADRIRHRGPDDGGEWADAGAGIAFGFRRLAIQDLSPAGHQPMDSASGRYVISFNGEVYNFGEIRRELEREGLAPAFRGHSDTEVMLAAFEAWGLHGALPRFVGMFAFALWDRRERRLHLVRDRVGIKPLYYGWSGGALLWGSELEALRGHPAFRGEVDRGALGLLLRHGYVPAPHSIYRGIRKLLPGTVLTFAAGALRDGQWPEPVPYWSARAVAEAGEADPFAGTDEEAIDRLDAAIRDAVGLRMIADVPLGAFLSGGVDSSLVAATMQAQSGRPVRTFSIGFREAAFDEAPHARAVARHLGTDHTELYVSAADAMQVIPRLPTLFSEPFADSSQLPTFLVSELARRHVTVSLSGDGGDELFAGYTRYPRVAGLSERIGAVPRPLRAGAAAAMAAAAPGGRALWSGMSAVVPGRWGHGNPWEKVAKLAELLRAEHSETLYRRMISHWDDPSLALRGEHAESSSVLATRSDWASLRSPLQRLMYLDTVSYLPDDILVKVDRASMAVSLEARVPLLDHRVVEFAWRLPLRLKVRGGQGKWILRQVLDRYVPRALIERPKMGFGVPVGEWLRGPLRDWAEPLLGERRLRDEGFFDPAPVRARWREHLSGRFNRESHLWGVLMFQAWLAEQGGA